MLLAKAMYSCGEKSEILQEVLHIDLIFREGEFTDLSFHIKLLLDNLQQLSPLDRNLYSERPLRLWNYILLAPMHSLKHLVVNSLARRMEIQAPQRQNHSLQKAILWEQAFQSSTLRFSKIRDLPLELYPLKSNRIY